MKIKIYKKEKIL